MDCRGASFQGGKGGVSDSQGRKEKRLFLQGKAGQVPGRKRFPSARRGGGISGAVEIPGGEDEGSGGGDARSIPSPGGEVKGSRRKGNINTR